MNANELTFGVEIETHIPAGATIVGDYHRPVQVSSLPVGWVAKTDSSIRCRRGRRGCEFVSPVLQGADGVRSLLAAVRGINALGARVNRSCGLHIHVGFDDSNREALARLVTLVANFETAIYASTGTKHRERGSYCAGVRRHGSSDEAQRHAGTYRYHVLNLTNLTQRRRPTVEFRAFAGTTSARKILGYVRLCLGLVERALVAKRPTNFIPQRPVESSPITRGGVGETELNRLMYQLGWTKGRTNHTYGAVGLDVSGAADIQSSKRELFRLARKYDRET